MPLTNTSVVSHSYARMYTAQSIDSRFPMQHAHLQPVPPAITKHLVLVNIVIMLVMMDHSSVYK